MALITDVQLKESAIKKYLILGRLVSESMNVLGVRGTKDRVIDIRSADAQTRLYLLTSDSSARVSAGNCLHPVGHRNCKHKKFLQIIILSYVPLIKTDKLLVLCPVVLSFQES